MATQKCVAGRQGTLKTSFRPIGNGEDYNFAEAIVGGSDSSLGKGWRPRGTIGRLLEGPTIGEVRRFNVAIFLDIWLCRLQVQNRH
jgi:hypothetical protein